MQQKKFSNWLIYAAHVPFVYLYWRKKFKIKMMLSKKAYKVHVFRNFCTFKFL